MMKNQNTCYVLQHYFTPILMDNVGRYHRDTWLLILNSEQQECEFLKEKNQYSNGTEKLGKIIKKIDILADIHFNLQDPENRQYSYAHCTKEEDGNGQVLNYSSYQYEIGDFIIS